MTSAQCKGVVFGAGSVGRGFIGQLLSEAGWKVIFVDANEELVQCLSENREYRHMTISRKGVSEARISPVTAIHASEKVAVAEAVESADLIVTCVGVQALPVVVTSMATGIARRVLNGGAPVSVLLAENLHHAADVVRELLEKALPEIDADLLQTQVGLMEASIGRMIPVPDAEMREADPTAILAEPYRSLPYDEAARRGAKLEVPGFVADLKVPFAFYVDRKLYVHNMGHFLCGLLGEALRLKQISEAVCCPPIREITRQAMLESCAALAMIYDQPLEELTEYADELLDRFDNPPLGDTIERVIRDISRKMDFEDRLIGAFVSAHRAGVDHKFLSLGVAIGVCRLSIEEGWDDNRYRSFTESLAAHLGVDLGTSSLELLDGQVRMLREYGLNVAEMKKVLDLTHTGTSQLER